MNNADAVAEEIIVQEQNSMTDRVTENKEMLEQKSHFEKRSLS